MARVLIGSKRIIPAPLVNISKSYSFTDDGQMLTPNYKLTLKGTLIPNRGSPTTKGWYVGNGDPSDEHGFDTDDLKFDALIKKQELLREVLGSGGFKFIYEPLIGNSVVCYPTLSSLNFTDDKWVVRSDYAIELEAATLQRDKTANPYVEDTASIGASGLNLVRATDDWQIHERDSGSGIYDITRNISATSRQFYVAAGMANGTVTKVEAWQNARKWVQTRISGSTMPSGNNFSLPTGNYSVFGYYNMIEEEAVDKLGGSYSINQRFVYHQNNYIDKRQISRVTELNINNDGGPTVTRISVQGSIEGLDKDNSPYNRLLNAYSYWNSIKDGLGVAVGANGSGITTSLDENQDAGTLNYSVAFVNNSDTSYRHVYDVNFSLADGFPTVTIAGQIEGITIDGLFGAETNKFARAVTGFNLLKPTLKAVAFAYTTDGLLFGFTNYINEFNDNPINKSVSFNRPMGTVNYSYTYGYQDQAAYNSGYTDTYNIDFSTQNSPGDEVAGLIVNASINGVINGITNGDDPTQRMTNAALGWNVAQYLLYTRINSEFAKIGGQTPVLANRPVTKAVSFNRAAGSINYNYSYNNNPVPSHTGVAVLDMSIEQTFPNDVFAVHVIPGRSSGPIIQNIGTKTEVRRSINVAMTMYPNSAGHWGYTDRPIIREIASGYLSSGINDWGIRGSGWFLAGYTENWDWKNGFYTATLNAVSATGV